MFLQIFNTILLIFAISPTVHGFDGSILLIHGEYDTTIQETVKSAIKELIKDGKIRFDTKDIINIPVKGKIPKLLLDAMCKQLTKAFKKGKVPLILDMSTPGVPSETVKSFSSALALPTVTACFGNEGDIKAWTTLEPEEEKYLVQISPPAETLIGVVEAIVTQLKITNIAVLYNDDFIPAFKATQNPIVTDLPVRIISKVISGDIRHQLKELSDKLEFKNYFILGDANDVLSEAEDLKYLAKHNWFVAKLKNESVDCDCESSILNIFPIPETESQDYLDELQGAASFDNEVSEIEGAFLYDLIIRAVLAAETMDKAGTWPLSNTYVLCANFTGNKVSPNPDFDFKAAIEACLCFANSALVWIDAQTMFYVFDYLDDFAFFKVDHPWHYAPFQYGRNGNSFMRFKVLIEQLTFHKHTVESDRKEIGFWRPGSNSFEETTALPLESLSTKPKYRVVTNEQPPFVIKSKGNKYTGLCIDILNNLSATLAFDYSIYDVPDGKMGYIDDNGEWSGIVSELIEKRADFAMTSISMMVERERVIDFTMPYYDPVGISILMKKPEVSTSLFKFLTVLEMDVWLCILAAYFLTSFLMWVFDRWSPYSYQNNKEKYKDDEEKRIFNFKESLWFCMTSLTPQGGGEAPKNLSGRLVAATWWLFGFIIMASYTANLAAFLTVSRLDTPIESLDDLSKQYKIQYAPVNGSSEMNYFQRMSNIENQFYEIWKDMSLNDSLTPVERSKLAVWDYPVSDKFTKMWQAITEAGLPSSLDDGLKRVRGSKSSSEGFALLGDGAENLYHYHTNCDLQIVGDEFSRKPYAIALQKGSHLREPFNNALQEMVNDGKLKSLKTEWWDQISTRTNCAELKEETDGISIKNIGGVFIVIVLGIGLAVITLTLEYFWYKGKRYRNSRDTGGIKDAWVDKSDSRNQKVQDAASLANKYLDPQNLYGDHFTRRPNAQRAYSNNYYQW